MGHQYGRIMLQKAAVFRMMRQKAPQPPIKRLPHHNRSTM